MPKAARKTTTAKAKKSEKIDPITVALDRCNGANRIFFDRARAADEQPDNQTAERQLARALASSERCGWELATTEPTTLAGASAMLTYIVDGPAVGLFDVGEMDWHETAFRTVTRALAKLARESRPAQAA
ncbi:hypothetical protein [Bradyrhizobium sp.]|uniref:hypothetical protein n=1 Tax=Bradyrhizobium sp. TaxID=376 RepID=UPI00260D5DCB|nr:hypothetical protein [Bradyrhizobium sp.]